MKLGDTLTLDFTTASPTTGAATVADSTPTVRVFEDASDTDLFAAGPLVPVLRSGTTATYRVQIACTIGNGFEAGKSYNVLAGATVGGIAGEECISTFVIDTVLVGDLSGATGVNLSKILGTALDETTPGWLATAFKKQYNIETPVLTAASVNQSADNDTKLTTIAADVVNIDAWNPTTALATLLADYARRTGDYYAGTPPTAGAIAGAVLDEAIGAHAGFLTTLATSDQVSALQVMTRAQLAFPASMERPDAGSTAYRIELRLMDETGNMEAPDAAPTIAAANQAGVDRSVNLDAATMSLVSTGVYRSTYSVASDAALEQITFTFSVTEGGATRSYAAASFVVETTAETFLASDRTNLNSIAAKLPSKAYLRGTADADGGMDTEDKADVNAAADTALTDYDGPTNAEMVARTVPAASYALEATLGNVTYGLSALKTLLDAIDTSTELAARFTEIKGAGWTAETLKAIKDAVTAAGTALSSQGVRDAMKLAPTVGAPDAGSVDSHLDLAALEATLGSPAGASVSADVAAVKADTGNLVARISAALFAGITSLANWLGALAGKTADVTTLAEIQATTAGTSYDNEADSQEAIRDRGDSAWLTGGAGAITEILNIQPLIPQAIDLANTASLRIALGLTNMLDDLPTIAEITPGTLTIERKAYGATTWTTVVDAAACSEAAGLVYYDEVFDAATGYARNDTLRFTFKNQKITVDANDFEITGADGWMFHGYIREDVWTEAERTLTSTAAEVASAIQGTALTITRGTTLSQSFSGLGSIANRSKLWFGVKRNAAEDTDAEAIVLIEETSGLLYIQGLSPTAASNGGITVTDEDAGNLTVTLKPADSSRLLVSTGYTYDVKVLRTTGAVELLVAGAAEVAADNVRAVS